MSSPEISTSSPTSSVPPSSMQNLDKLEGDCPICPNHKHYKGLKGHIGAAHKDVLRGMKVSDFLGRLAEGTVSLTPPPKPTPSIIAAPVQTPAPVQVPASLSGVAKQSLPLSRIVNNGQKDDTPEFGRKVEMELSLLQKSIKLDPVVLMWFDYARQHGYTNDVGSFISECVQDYFSQKGLILGVFTRG